MPAGQASRANPTHCPTDKPPAPDKAEFPRRKSGRVAFDADGRGIWEWQTATGVFERNVTDEQVAKLEDTTLSILEDAQPQGTSIYDSTTTKTIVRRARSAPTKRTESSVLSRSSRHSRECGNPF